MQQLEQVGDVGEWRALACNVLVIIGLSEGACHWFPSRFEASVQQSILLNFQGCQQHDQMCIKNPSAEYLFNQEIGSFPSSLLSFSLFIFLLVKYIQMASTGPRGWICCHGEKSELFSPVVWVSDSTTQISAALPAKLSPVLCILSAFGHWFKGRDASPVVPGVSWQDETSTLVFVWCCEGMGRSVYVIRESWIEISNKEQRGDIGGGWQLSHLWFPFFSSYGKEIQTQGV